MDRAYAEPLDIAALASIALTSEAHFIRTFRATFGATGGHLFFTTDDCRKTTYNELKAKGVEFTEEPTERPYGIDCGLRDPFGNHIRFSQPTTRA